MLMLLLTWELAKGVGNELASNTAPWRRVPPNNQEVTPQKLSVMRTVPVTIVTQQITPKLSSWKQSFCFAQFCGLGIQEGVKRTVLTWVAHTAGCWQVSAGAAAIQRLDRGGCPGGSLTEPAVDADSWPGALLGHLLRVPTQAYPIGQSWVPMFLPWWMASPRVSAVAGPGRSHGAFCA